MARLKMLRDKTHRLASKVRYLGPERAVQSRARDDRNEWRGWYKTARWQKLRWSVLWRDRFTCVRCGWRDSVMSAVVDALAAAGFTEPEKGSAPTMVADHKEPHRGDEALFWDDRNLQCLCKPCHDRDKQREEAAGLRSGRFG